MTNAERQRRYLARQRDGLCVRRVLVHDVRITEVLHALGYLPTSNPTPEEADAALSRFVFETMTRHETELWPGNMIVGRW
jgi:hypothetical protein